jgi:hypothetical protein
MHYFGRQDGNNILTTVVLTQRLAAASSIPDPLATKKVTGTEIMNQERTTENGYDPRATHRQFSVLWLAGRQKPRFCCGAPRVSPFSGNPCARLPSNKNGSSWANIKAMENVQNPTALARPRPSTAVNQERRSNRLVSKWTLLLVAVVDTISPGLMITTGTGIGCSMPD